ncbi:hypothetical protein GOBAR_AA09096 [Gossypium barbadense]|uniref:Uncharacterized protein n=1 Tax=Gossypium barbadense TaxID=3634 RepID=A0A2P5Y7I4_GOSBA|nr:hypothetical protein GOBAR_AA09096 [Gossypium barbadense]
MAFHRNQGPKVPKTLVAKWEGQSYVHQSTAENLIGGGDHWRSSTRWAWAPDSSIQQRLKKLMVLDAPAHLRHHDVDGARRPRTTGFPALSIVYEVTPRPKSQGAKGSCCKRGGSQMIYSLEWLSETPAIYSMVGGIDIQACDGRGQYLG